ncbi:MAG: GNAT family N-acetyltransferase [Clostridia bacterium]|nr:GNAT family N-acetyltransferase [Clostridia bacterium]
MKTVIRRAVPTDADQILLLLEQIEDIHRQGRPDLFREHGTKYTASELCEIMADADRPIFVALIGDKIVGYIFGIITETKGSTMLFDMKTLHLDDVCIDESCRGMGIGGELMEHVMAWAKSVGCDRMDLDVWEFNGGARRFYEKYGFSTQKRRMDMWI